MTPARARPGFGTRLARGAGVGACCGFAFGVLEVLWLGLRGDVAATARLILWSALADAAVFAIAGAFFEAASAAIPPARLSAAPSAGTRPEASGTRPTGAHATFACFVLGALTLGRWRYYLDESLAPGERPASKLLVVAILLALGAILGTIASRLVARLGPARFALASIATSLVFASAFAVQSTAERPARSPRPSVDAAPPVAGASGSGSPAPHVFLIVADSLRADALSVSRRSSGPPRGGAKNAPGASELPDPMHAVARTPQLDRLARESIVFDALCAQSSWTRPGFASILTGLPPRSHRAIRRTSRLPLSVTTLAELFQAHGYFTFGHSNANPNYSAAARFDQGFEEFEDLEPPRRHLLAPPGAGRLALYHQVVDPVLTRIAGHEAGQFYVPADDYTDRILARLRELPQPATRPIFAVLHYMDPHYPYFAGAKRGRPTLLGSEAHRAGGAALARSLRGAYLGDVERLDRHLGRLFDALRAQGLYDDAIVVFTSDHGEELFEHAAWGHGRSLYREVTHVPLLIKLPGARGAGTRIAALASQTDLAPTLLALAGLAIPDPMVGAALLAADGTPARRAEGECLSTLDTAANQIESLRTPTKTLIRTLHSKQRRLAPVELYDPLADPEETTNLARPGDPVLADLEARLSAARALGQPDEDSDDELPLAPNVASQLRALGYVDDD
ncbi:MAG: sulfatase [Myxococcota bacterium]